MSYIPYPVVTTDEGGGQPVVGGVAVPGGNALYVPGVGVPVSLPAGRPFPTAAGQLRQINEAIKAAGEFVPAYGYPAQPRYTGEFVLPGLYYQGAQLEYVSRELAGIYGFMVQTLAGGEPLEDAVVLQSAARAYNLAQRFWEARLGGLGGELSEIGRRFLPHPMRTEEFNPIRNLMLLWLPGREGIIDFLHGDPYCVSPDTLIEVGDLQFVRAVDIQEGNLIITHKGRKLPVKRLAKRPLNKGEKAYSLKVVSLSGVEMVFSEEHPILVVDNPSQRRNYKQYVRIRKYELANDVLSVLEQGILCKCDIAQKLNISVCYLGSILSFLEKDGKIIKNGKKQPVILLDSTKYDITLLKNGLRWVPIKELKPGQYVVYPRPKVVTKDIILDLAELTGYPATDEWIYISGSTKLDSTFPECYEWLLRRESIYFKRGERKKILQEKGWKASALEAAQGYIRRGIVPERVKRYITITDDIAYLFGLYLAEGFVNEGYVGFALNLNEFNLYERALRGAVQIDPDCRGSFYPIKGTNGAQAFIFSTVVSRLLRSLFGCGARNKSIPEEFYKLSRSILGAFLRGLFDGDGCYFTTNGGCSFSSNEQFILNLASANQIMLLQVRKLLLREGIVANLNCKDTEGRVSFVNGKPCKSGKNWNLIIRGFNARQLAAFLGYEYPELSEHSASWSFVTDDFVCLRVLEVKEVDNVEYVIGFEVDEDDSFCVAGVATHNTKIPYGEVRLPGEAYERTHILHPDIYGRYGAVDRFLILADIAPYSPQARYWRDVATHMQLPEDLRKQVSAAKRRMAELKREHTFYPYHFQVTARDLAWETVHVEGILDLGMFLTREYPEHPIRIAGINVQGLSAQELAQYIRPGMTVRIAYDPYQKISDDTYQTIRAAVFVGNQSVARMLIEEGMVKERLTDWSAAGVWSRFTRDEIAKAAFYEKIAHLDLPLMTKFLNVRSPLESYIREEVYGVRWAGWEHPWSQWIRPTYEAYIARNPFLAALSGATLGGFLGHFVFGRRGKWGALIGGLTTFLGSLWRTAYEEFSGTPRWIPERVQRRREIEEYFDILKYLKYRGLYEYARREAAREGIDVEELIEGAQADLERRRFLRNVLEKRKREIFLATGDRFHPLIKEINQQLNMLEASAAKYVELSPWAAAALYYYQQYTSTVYGFEPGAPYTNILRALPTYEREYFIEFAQATSPEERRQILELVPPAHRRIYESLWGMRVERRVPLEEYFKTHYLPSPEWIGWRPEVNLEDVKVKVVQNEAMDIHDFDLWPSDVKRAELSRAPVLREPFTPPPISIFNIRRDLINILQGRGLRNVSVDVMPAPDFSIELDILRDRSEEIRQKLRDDFPLFLAS